MGLKFLLSLLFSVCITTGATAQLNKMTATVHQPAGSILLPSAARESTDTLTPQNRPLYTAEDVFLYLPVPANIAGSITEDGTQVDVIVLGPRLTRGAEYEIIPVGVMEFDEDNGIKQRVLAIPANPSFQTIKSPTLEQLRLNYPGVIEILILWFENAFGNRQSNFLSLKDEQDSLRLFRQ